MTRHEHLEWAKKRALEYVEAGDNHNAVMSMLSDLRKHEDTAGSVELGFILAPFHGTAEDTRSWIEGFNG